MPEIAVFTVLYFAHKVACHMRLPFCVCSIECFIMFKQMEELEQKGV